MRTAILVMALVAPGLGCGGAPPMMESAMAPGGALGEAMAEPVAATGAGHSAQASVTPVVSPDAPTALPVPSEQRLRLIYTAQLGLVVEFDTVEAAIDAVVASTLEFGGYLSRRDDTLVIVRVPSEKFHESLAAFEQLGVVNQRQIQVQDVSEEFHDLEVRIASLVALHERMRALLERTSNLEEVLRIETELGRLAGQIDQVRGRIRFLGSQTTWSTITVNVREQAAQVAEPPPPAPPAARSIRLPIDWLNETGLSGLLNLD